MTRANVRFWQGKLLDWTAWVDVHPLVATPRFPGIPERRADAWGWYLKQDGTRPIYLMDPEQHPHGANLEEARRRFKQVPGAVAFPIREIQRAFPINGEPNRWFVEQAGMMIAMAVMQGYERIILNGIGCITTLEFERAHRTILYWIAFAQGRGVTVEVEGPSIFHMPREIYAYQKFNYDELKQARQDIKDAENRPDINGLLAVNAKERRRGRPPKHRVEIEDFQV